MTTIVTCINRSVLAIYCFLQVISNSFLSLFIISALLFIDWKTTLIAFAIFSLSYFLIGQSTKRKLKKNSQKILALTENQIKTIQEGLGSLRDLILNGNYNLFLKIYSKADTRVRRINAENRFLSIFPRFLIESISISLISLLAYLFAIVNNNNDVIIPILGSIALGAQRLLPSMQQIYSNWSQMTSYKSDLINVLKAVNEKVYKETENFKLFIHKKNVKFDRVFFSYIKNKEILSDVSLNIKHGENIGLIGRTGSGKSTIVDILMGLLIPQKENFSR